MCGYVRRVQCCVLLVPWRHLLSRTHCFGLTLLYSTPLCGIVQQLELVGWHVGLQAQSVIISTQLYRAQWMDLMKTRGNRAAERRWPRLTNPKFRPHRRLSSNNTTVCFNWSNRLVLPTLKIAEVQFSIVPPWQNDNASHQAIRCSSVSYANYDIIPLILWPLKECWPMMY